MIEAIFAGLLGLLIGSFLNVCIYRLPRDLSVVRPRSFCPDCEKPVSAYDNVPVVSWLLLGARCRNCRARIPFRYPLVELLTGIFFFLGVWKLGLTWAALRFVLFAAILITLLFTDLETRILPDEFTKTGIVLGFVFAYLAPMPAMLPAIFMPSETPAWKLSLMEAALGAVGLSLLLWSVGAMYQALRKREGLGFGDVKMIAMIGAFTGLSGALSALLYGSVVGSLVGLGLVYFARKDPKTYEIPLGSFLAAAALAITTLRLFT